MIPRPERAQTLSDALVAQCRAEGAWGYRVLVAASCSSSRLIRAARSDALGADNGEMIEELERLCEQRILRVDGLRFRFRYDLVRQALVNSISPARRRLLEQQLDRFRASTRPVTRPAGHRSQAGWIAMGRDRDLMCGTFFENASEPAYVMDPSTDRIIAANDAGLPLLGYTRHELTRVVNLTHPSHRDAELSELLEACPPIWAGRPRSAHLPNEEWYVPPDRDLAVLRGPRR